MGYLLPAISHGFEPGSDSRLGSSLLCRVGQQHWASSVGWGFGVGHGDGVLLCSCRARCVVVVVVAVFSCSGAEVSHDACCDEDPFDGKFRKLFIDQESTGKLRGCRKQLWMQGM